MDAITGLPASAPDNVLLTVNIRTNGVAQANLTPPLTPTPATAKAHVLHKEICEIHEELKTCEDLKPSGLVNRLLTRLAELCVQRYNIDVVDAFFAIDGVMTLCQDLQGLCSEAECELETEWVGKTLRGILTYNPAYTRSLLSNFPYYGNYEALSRLEASVLLPFLPCAWSSNFTGNMAFVGSGPLPLSSVFLAEHFPYACVTNVDRDEGALRVSRELIQQLAMGHHFVCEDPLVGPKDPVHGVSWSACDVVFVAALVGKSAEEKIAVLKNLAPKLKKGCVVVCRSATGLRQLLYPRLELDEEVEEMYETLAELHPYTEVVNSVAVMRKK